MTNLLRLSPPALTVACILFVQAPVTFGWIPRILTACKCKSLRISGSDVAGRQGRLLLSASKDDSNAENNGKFDGGESDDFDPEVLPLFVEGGKLNSYVSRLEAIYDLGSDFYTDDSEDIITSSTKSQRLLEEGERVVLGDWMEWDDGKCVGDSCGDDSDQCEIPESYKVSSPKVDVMSFLGIRRAEPIKVQRDWD